jgi:hypothetical protein
VTDVRWSRPVEAVGLLVRGHTLSTALPTAVVVGTVLCAVNQGATLVTGQAVTGTWVRMVINYLVLASVGYLGARRRVGPRVRVPAGRTVDTRGTGRSRPGWIVTVVRIASDQGSYTSAGTFTSRRSLPSSTVCR